MTGTGPSEAALRWRGATLVGKLARSPSPQIQPARVVEGLDESRVLDDNSSVTVEDQFDRVVERMIAFAGVTPPGSGSGFGSTALRYQGKIFAMLAHERLVVKLSEAQVAELVTDGDGDFFTAGKGKPLKQWFSVNPGSQLSWEKLAIDALHHLDDDGAT